MGGLTRRTGVKKTRRSIWFFSMPISSTFNLKMKELIEVYFEISGQHKSATNKRLRKSLSHLKQI